MADYTISQALRRVSKLKGLLAEQLQRAQQGVTYVYDEPPAFAFKASVEQAELIRTEMIALQTQLRVTNALTKIDFDGRKITLAEATCVLQELKGKIAWYKTLPVQSAAERRQQHSTWDLVKHEHVMVEKLHKCDLPEVDRAVVVKREQDVFDRLNDAVETANHRTQLATI